ncbi:hypothetical protein [Arthrobacter sp. ISL-95]
MPSRTAESFTSAEWSARQGLLVTESLWGYFQDHYATVFEVLGHDFE